MGKIKIGYSFDVNDTDKKSTRAGAESKGNFKNEVQFNKEN